MLHAADQSIDNFQKLNLLHTHIHTQEMPHTHNTKIELGANERREENSIPGAPSSRAERGWGWGLVYVHILKCAYHAGLIHNEVRRREIVHHQRTHHRR
jgi:hypothetical protein